MIQDLDAEGAGPQIQWEPALDFDAATKKLVERHGEDADITQFYKSSVVRALAIVHDWRVRALLLMIPPDCHHEYEQFYNANAKRKVPKPMPFDRWGLDVNLIHEPAYIDKAGTILTTKGGDESSGFSQRHELQYGRRLISYIEYSFMPQSESVNTEGGEAPALWSAEPERWSPFLVEKLGAAVGDPTAVRKIGNAWVSLAMESREPLIEAVVHYEKHRYPPYACKLKFIGPNKAADALVEVEPEFSQGVPVWTLGQLPQA